MEAIYNSSNSFKVLNDRVSEFIVDRRVKMDCGLDGVKYASVVSSSYSAPYTTVQIDESDLTAALTDVWYGVVTKGTEGSLPNHSHDGSEGSGGIATSFSGIDDHGHAAYVPWDFGSGTISGTGDIHAGAFYGDGSTLGGIVISGTDDHSHVAYVPWNFGSSTISGTGDIYCNDIYTSSGTVYIGDVQLTTSGGNLLVDGQTIVGQGYYFGEGEPAIAADIDDIYLDTNTGNVYQKISEFGDIIDINLCVSGTGYSDSVFNDDPAYGGDKAFDGLPATTLWHSKSTSYPIYIQYQFTEPQTIGKLRMLSNSFNLRMPRDFTLKGSNTGAFSGEEVDIVSYSGEVYVATAWNELVFSNTEGAFIYYRINITGASDSYQNIQEIEMMGIDTSGWELVYTPVQSLLDLTDTPAVYDDGKFLRSTSSGTEWITVSGVGGDYVPWNFGAGTISGTGDIYCNDIYTSSGTVYIGDTQLTTSGGSLLVDGQTVDGAIWIVASGTPYTEIGNPHDMYLNQENYDIYQQQDIGIEYDPVKTNIPSMTHDESITFQGPPSVVSDGNENTYWQINNTTNQWVSIDLGSSEPVYKVLLEGLTGASDRFVKNFRVEASYNNSDWDVIYTGLTVQNTAPQEFTFSALSAAYRYWRLYAIDNWGGSYLTVTRFELYTVIYLQNYDWVQTGNIKGEAGDPAPTTVSGIILIAPNSSEWLLQVTNSGTLYTTEVV